MKTSIIAAALSLLVLPAATAFAGEGSFQPQAVASAASGAGGYASVGQSFVYNQAEGGQQDQNAAPAFTAGGFAPVSASTAANQYNAGLNG